MLLIQTLQATTPQSRSLLVVGDINSSPLDPLMSGSILTPYMQFALAGYSDAWLLRPGNVPGLTCCQLTDLSNRKAELYERIDMLFSLEPPTKVKDARVVGTIFSAGMRHLLGHGLREGLSHLRREGECLQPWHGARSSS